MQLSLYDLIFLSSCFAIAWMDIFNIPKLIRDRNWILFKRKIHIDFKPLNCHTCISGWTMFVFALCNHYPYYILPFVTFAAMVSVYIVSEIVNNGIINKQV